jgi:ribosome-associated translation inhibitor RaiA
MNLTISGHHLEVPALRGYAQQLDRITRHFDQVVDAESC